MKEEILQKLAAVITALDAIAVVGQQNRGNLYGGIEALKAIAAELASAEFAPQPVGGEETQ